jgi:signal transduction histidine kinase
MALVDHRGTVWVATSNGLNHLDPATGRIRVYHDRDGLPNDNLNGVLEDDRGDIWISTNRGLSRFDPRTKQFRNYYVSDGLVGNEFYRRNCAWKSPAGEMFFCTSVGLTAFLPSRIVDDSNAPPVVLTDFLLSEKAVPIGSDSPLKQSISVTRSLVLQPNQNIFSFEFAALSYANSDLNRYRYRLEGLEPEWNERDSSHRTVAYTTLPPGTYTFRVQGSNHRGAWNEAGTSIRIRILPAFSQTVWFRMSCAGAFVLGLWGLYRLRVRQIAVAMNARFDERNRLAGELHDTILQTVQAAKLIADNACEHYAEKPAQLIATMDNISEWMEQAATEGRAALVALRSTEENNLAGALQRLSYEFRANSPATFKCSVSGTPRRLNSPVQDEIYRIACEAIRNAYRHSEATELEVNIAFDENVSVTVSDNGKGIAPEIANAGRAGHFGLRVMQERANRIGATLRIASRANGGTTIALTSTGRVAFLPSEPARPTVLAMAKALHFVTSKVPFRQRPIPEFRK